MCCKAASPGAEGAPAMSRAGRFVIYLFGMGAVNFEYTSTCSWFFQDNVRDAESHKCRHCKVIVLLRLKSSHIRQMTWWFKKINVKKKTVFTVISSSYCGLQGHFWLMDKYVGRQKMGFEPGFSAWRDSSSGGHTKKPIQLLHSLPSHLCWSISK